MKRTFLKLGFILIAYQFLLAACVIVEPVELNYSQIDNLNISANYYDEVLEEGAVIGSQELQLKVELEVQYLADRSPSLLPKTYAESPYLQEGLGLKNKLTALHVTANTEVDGFPTDHSLNEILYVKLGSETEKISISQLIDMLNSQNCPSTFSINFLEPFHTEAEVSFSIILEFEDGSALVGDTQSVSIIE